MRFIRAKAVVAGLGLALSLAACGDAGDDDDGGDDVEVQENAADEFDDGTRMKELAETGKIVVGVRYDQPGLGFKGATDDIPERLRHRGRQAAGRRPRHRPGGPTRSPTRRRSPTTESRSSRRARSTWCWRRTPSPTSVASSRPDRAVLPHRSAGAGPADSDVESIGDLAGQEVCSVTGSTSSTGSTRRAPRASASTATPSASRRCWTAPCPRCPPTARSSPGSPRRTRALKVVGEAFSEERIGVGYSLDSPEMCEWINGVLRSPSRTARGRRRSRTPSPFWCRVSRTSGPRRVSRGLTHR